MPLSTSLQVEQDLFGRFGFRLSELGLSNGPHGVGITVSGRVGQVQFSNLEVVAEHGETASSARQPDSVSLFINNLAINLPIPAPSPVGESVTKVAESNAHCASSADDSLSGHED